MYYIISLEYTYIHLSRLQLRFYFFTVRTKPSTLWGTLDAYTLVVEPFVLIFTIITCNHASSTALLAFADVFVVTVTFYSLLYSASQNLWKHITNRKSSQFFPVSPTNVFQDIFAPVCDLMESR